MICFDAIVVDTKTIERISDHEIGQIGSKQLLSLAPPDGLYEVLDADTTKHVRALTAKLAARGL